MEHKTYSPNIKEPVTFFQYFSTFGNFSYGYCTHKCWQNIGALNKSHRCTRCFTGAQSFTGAQNFTGMSLRTSFVYTKTKHTLHCNDEDGESPTLPTIPSPVVVDYSGAIGATALMGHGGLEPSPEASMRLRSSHSHRAPSGWAVKIRNLFKIGTLFPSCLHCLCLTGISFIVSI